MMASTSYDGINASDRAQDSLFQGMKFWISQRVPQRIRFTNDVRSNGGEIVSIEQLADVKIVDHARKEAMPGTYSYTFIERSIRNATLEELDNHIVGPPGGTARPVGSIVQPQNPLRQRFTIEDDRILWNWVESVGKRGGSIRGNEIYKQLHKKHPNHPWQSWRDRYIKYVEGRPPPFPLPHNSPLTPPSEPIAAPETETMAQGSTSTPVSRVAASVDWPHTAHSNTNTYTDDSLRDGNDSDNREARSLPPHSQTERLSKQPHIEVTQAEKKSKPTNPEMVVYEGLDVANSTNQIRSDMYQHSSQEEVSEMRPVTASQELPMLSSEDIQHTARSSFKRKYSEVGTELPQSLSSSGHERTPEGARKPPVAPREIASTPESSPYRHRVRPHAAHQNSVISPESTKRTPSPLFVPQGESARVPEDADDEPSSAFGTESSKSNSDKDIDAPMLSYVGTHGRATIEAHTRDMTPFIDFDVPPPENGWESQFGRDSKSAEVITNEEGSDAGDSQVSFGMQDTQQLLQGRTQVPEFEVPVPDGGWDLTVPSSPPDAVKPHAVLQEDSSLDDVASQLDQWIDSYVKCGYGTETVEEVLKATSMDSKLAETVLEYMQHENSMSRNLSTDAIPIDWQGVWTSADDQALSSTDARDLLRVEKKHGKAFVTVRWDFLEFYNRDG